MITIARKIVYLCAMLILALATLAVGLNVHELGHTVVARFGGDSAATYYLYHREVNGSYCMGCNVYDERHLSYMGNIAVTMAGVATTQIIVICCLVWLPRITKGLARQILIVVVVALAVDAPIQVLQAAMANVAAQRHLTRVDLADTLYLIMMRLPFSPLMLKALLLVCLASYGCFAIYLFQRGRTRTRSAA